LRGASTRSRGSFLRVQQAARAIDKGRAGNRSVARSCRPPVCSDRCSTFRKAPSVRPCTDRRDVRTWRLRPYNQPPPRLYAPPRSAARSSVSALNPTNQAVPPRRRSFCVQEHAECAIIGTVLLRMSRLSGRTRIGTD